MKNKVGLACLVETKIKKEKFGEFYVNSLQWWCITSNFSYGNGGRILILWLANCFEVDVIEASAQFIRLRVKNMALNNWFHCSFVYAFNEAAQRKALWNGLKKIGDKIDGPWVVVGDFNCPLVLEDRIGRTLFCKVRLHLIVA